MTGNSKRVLLIHRFFYPDSPPYALMLDDVRNHLINKGYRIDVLSSQPSYKTADKVKNEKYVSIIKGGSTVYRLPVFRFKKERINKVLNFFSFPVLVFFFLLSRKYDVITVSTAPPVVLAFLVAVVVRIRGGRLIYHCMDIHPEIGRISGEFENSLIFKFFTWMDNFTCRAASKIIVLSSDMKASLKSRKGLCVENIEVINNYDLSDGDVSDKPFFEERDDKKRVVFAGNIGRFQSLEVFILALKNNPKLKNLELIFVGEGAALLELKRLAKGLGDVVKFVPQQSVSVARRIISEADFGIVSLQRGVISFAYPSKTMTYLSEGTPVLLNVDKDTEIAGFIAKEGLGLLINRPDINQVYDAFREINDDNLSFCRKYVKKTFNRYFSKKQFQDKFSRLIVEQMERS